MKKTNLLTINLSNIKVLIGPEQKLLFHIENLSIKEGEKILIKGASGKGKTTFLHLLAGLLLPNSGALEIGGTDLTKLSELERAQFRRAHMGIIFQKLNLIDYLTALENIQLSLKGKNDFQKGLDALASVGLGGRENNRTGVLSLGEQQRVAIARVLASESSIVFADEPTSSLDEKNASEVIEVLLKSCQHKTLIVVSHDHRIEKYFTTIKDFGEMIS